MKIDRFEITPGLGTAIRFGGVVAWADPAASPALISFLVQSVRNLGPSLRGGRQIADHIAAVLVNRDPEPAVGFAVIGPSDHGWATLLHGPVQVWDGSRWLYPPANPGWIQAILTPKPVITVSAKGAATPSVEPNSLLDLEAGVVPGHGFVLIPAAPARPAKPSEEGAPRSRVTRPAPPESGRDIPTTVLAATGPPTALLEALPGKASEQEAPDPTRAQVEVQSDEPEPDMEAGTPGPDVTGLDIAGPDVAGPDVTGLDIAGPDVAGPDVAGPDVAEPDVAEPDVAELELVEGPDGGGAKLGEPDVAGPDIPGPDIPGPDIAAPEPAPAPPPRPVAPGPAGSLDLRTAAAPTRPPLPPVGSPSSAVTGAPVVAGVACRRGHFNRPGLSTCVRCGTAIPTDADAASGSRPPLGTLVLDNGTIFRIDRPYLVGSHPGRDPSVSGGLARPLALAGGDVSGTHAELRMHDWDVMLIDRGSATGTSVFEPGASGWVRLNAFEPRIVPPGTHMAFGQRIVTFIGPWARAAS
jgi:hypothetical protein